MSSIRLKHASGNSMSLAAPGTNPASNLELKLPHTIGSANQLLKVDANGQLGWATDSTTDSTKLPLAGGTLTGTLTSNSNINTTGSISGSNLTLTHGDPKINFVDSGDNPDYQVVVNAGHFMIKDATASADRLYINASSTTITNNLNVNAGLDVTGNVDINNGTGQAHYQITQTNGNTVKFGIVSGSDVELSGSANNSMYFKTNNTEKLRITAEGHLKILGQGQTTGFYLTNSYGQAGLFGGIYFNGSSWTRDAHATRKGAGMYINTGGHVVFLTSSESSGTTATVAERLRITSDGLLLLGTTDSGFSSGYTNMTIGNTSTQNTGLTIVSSSSNGYSRLHFSDGTSGAARYAGWIVYDHAVDAIKFSTANSGSSKVSIDSSGKLWVDRTHASATTGDHPALDIDTYANGTAGATFATGIDFRVAGVHKKRLVVTNVDSSAGTGDWIFYRDQGNNEGLRIANDGNITAPATSKFSTQIAFVNTFRSAGSVIGFNNAHVNDGNDLNTTNNRFVAPVDGAYYFHFHTNVDTNVGAGTRVEFYFDWRVNGSAIVSSKGGRFYGEWTGYGWEHISACIMLHLSDGDYVDITTGRANMRVDGGNYGQFTGWLVG